jgi:hypothetical protein
MLVKQKYSHLSETLLHEWSLENATQFNRHLIYAYAFWFSIKDLPFEALTFQEVIRLEKISENQYNQLKPKRYKRR